nr:hypothetical protein [Lacipirellula parvula]
MNKIVGRFVIEPEQERTNGAQGGAFSRLVRPVEHVHPWMQRDLAFREWTARDELKLFQSHAI